MIIETLVLKGLWTAGHWAVAHGTSGLAAKGGAILAKSVATHGLAATASSVAGGAIATGFIVGGVTWSKPLVQLLCDAVVDLSNGDLSQGLVKFATLYNKIHGVDIEYFPDVVETVLNRVGFDPSDSSTIAEFVRDNELNILERSNLI